MKQKRLAVPIGVKLRMAQNEERERVEKEFMDESVPTGNLYCIIGGEPIRCRAKYFFKYASDKYPLCREHANVLLHEMLVKEEKEMKK